MPPQPTCGDIVTSNVSLTGDLVCSGLTGTPGTPVFALKVGADNVTINLGGFSILGPASFGAIGTNAGACPSSFGATTNRTIGILVDGFDGARILNGSVNSFEFGMMLKSAENVRISNVEAANNAFNALSVGDFDGQSPSAKGGVLNLAVDRVYFHDNRNDAIGVSAGSQMSMSNSLVKDNCASGIFAAPRSFGGFPASTPLANVEIKSSAFVDNFRSAVNFWGAEGSVENSLIKGNNVTAGGGSDFGQISLKVSRAAPLSFGATKFETQSISLTVA